MNLTKDELISEEKYLNDTLEETKKIIQEKEKTQREFKKDIIKAKKHLWQNNNEYSGAEMYSTMFEEDLETSIVNENEKKITKLYRSLYSPYFGKVLFKSDKLEEPVYIGLTGIESKEKVYVYDWRAPIANLYYNYGIGPSKYSSPLGDITGENINKKQFKIESGKLLEAFNTDVTIEDELLQEALLSNNTDKMKNIVSTIQKEQNEIIRYTKKNHLIIEGVAGSGKTSVAMHRIAYLLYNEKNITNKNVLVISPSSVFSEYISDVLPDLGEEAVPTITMEEFIKKYISFDKIANEFKKEDTFKYENDYIRSLDKALLEYFNSLNFKSKLGLKKKFITSIELNGIFKKKSHLTSINYRIDYLVNKICDLYDISYDKNGEALTENIKRMLKIPTDPIELYKTVMRTDSIDSYISYMSALYIYFEVNGYPQLAHIKHVIIDEVQDYPYLTLKVLAKCFPSAQFTLLGDIHQSMNEYFKYPSLSCLKEVFKDANYIRLDKTYRSSYEIIEYTNNILNIKGVSSIRNPIGIPVLEKSGLLEDVKVELDRLSKKYKRVALIVEENKIDECTDFFVDKDTALISTNSLKSRLIVPINMVKGLEFDAVIIYLDKNSDFVKNETNKFYVAATRAVHELVIFNK